LRKAPARSKFVPILWLAATADTPPFARARACRAAILAPPWTCCGFASKRKARTRRTPWDASRQAPSWSCSTAATIGCAFVIAKASLDELRRVGLAAFKANLTRLVPLFAGRLDALKSWDDIKLLTVAVDRLERWYRTGLLCIGDAAHAMSPVGGVGINLAVQDAVAAANILWRPLKEGTVQEEDLRKVQERRMFPTRVIQALQLIIQNRLIGRALGSAQSLPAPLVLRLTDRVPLLRRIPARIVGMGVRPEHVRTPEARPA